MILKFYNNLASFHEWNEGDQVNLQVYDFIKSGEMSKENLKILCVLYDEDDGQPEESYGRIIGVIYCNDMNLNEELLDAGLGYLENRFCDSSEFASDSWAQKHGC